MRKTDQLLQQAKFSKRYQGYHYLLLCVELAAEDELRLCSLIKQIYQPVADQYQLTYQDIERNIRTARCFVMITPWAPARFAVRMIAPRL